MHGEEADAEDHRRGATREIVVRPMARNIVSGPDKCHASVVLIVDYSCESTFSQELTSTPGFDSTSSLTIVPSSITAA